MSNHTYTPADIDELVDIQSMNIDPARPAPEKKELYFRQIGIRGCCRFEDVKVRLSHSDTDVSFEDRIKQLLLSGQGMDLISN